MNAGRSRPWLAAAAAYTALAIAYTWPLASRMSSAFPHDPFDPALNTWILWWDAHVVPLTTRWWNAPFFWPVPGALALSEHLLGIAVLTTPLQWAGASPLAAYNAAFIVSFAASALAAHFLVWSIIRRHEAAAIAGVAYGFALYRLDQLPHLQVLWSFGMPIALGAAHMYLDRGRARWLFVFAASWIVQALSNGYFLLFFPLLAGAWMLWHLPRSPRRIAWLATTWVAASIPLVPILAVYHRVQGDMHLERSINEIQSFSADLTALVAAPIDSAIWHRLAAFEHPEGAFFPGVVVLALVTAGAAIGWIRRDHAEEEPAAIRRFRRAMVVAGMLVAAVACSVIVLGPWRLGGGVRPIVSVARFDKPLTVALYLLGGAFLASPALRSVRRRQSEFAFYLLAALGLFVLAVGPRPHFNGTPVLFRAPYSLLLALPGFNALRVPARLGTLVMLSLAAAAALAFARFTSTAPAGRKRLLAAAAAGVIALECWPTFRVVPAPLPDRLLSNLPADAAVLELPLGTTDRDVAAMYRGMEHHRPTVNGYSGYDPPHYLVLKIALARADVDALDAVAAGRPLFVAVEHGPEFDRWAGLVMRHPRCAVVADDDRWRVFRVDPTDPAPRQASVRLPIASVSANRQPDAIDKALDGNIRTLWNAGQLQKGNESVLIDLGRERTVDEVRLELGPYVYDFPRSLVVECQGAEAPFEPCWTGSTGALLIRGILANQARAAMDIPIARTGVTRIRLRQTAADDRNGWSIAELEVFGR